jgi:hypothetical protein
MHIRCSKNDQQYALIVPLLHSIYCLVHISAVACHHQGAYELLEIQIKWVVYHIMCGYVYFVPDCHGSFRNHDNPLHVSSTYLLIIRRHCMYSKIYHLLYIQCLLMMSKQCILLVLLYWVVEVLPKMAVCWDVMEEYTISHCRLKFLHPEDAHSSKMEHIYQSTHNHIQAHCSLKTADTGIGISWTVS